MDNFCSTMPEILYLTFINALIQRNTIIRFYSV